MLNKGLDELLAETSQAVAVLAGESLALTLWGQLLSAHRQEIEVRGESTQKVQNIVSAIISDDAFTLDRGAQLHCVVLLVQHAVSLDLKFTSSMWQNELAGQTEDLNTQFLCGGICQALKDEAGNILYFCKCQQMP